jgi:hypothetical protein
LSSYCRKYKFKTQKMGFQIAEQPIIYSDLKGAKNVKPQPFNGKLA